MTTPREREHLDEILQYLQQTHGFDFSAYKRPSLVRRILKRMQSVDVHGYEEYLDYLQMHQDEFGQLFNTILINVTAFFRDSDVWSAVADEIVPRLLETQPNIRVWSAGCASGQEPYSLAMLFADAHRRAGPSRARQDLRDRRRRSGARRRPQRVVHGARSSGREA